MRTPQSRWRAGLAAFAVAAALAACSSPSTTPEITTVSSDAAAADDGSSTSTTTGPTTSPTTVTSHKAIPAPKTHRTTTHRATPKPTHRATPKPKAPARIVHPGAYCSPAGATGVTAKGTAMVCKGPGRDRWRAA